MSTPSSSATSEPIKTADTAAEPVPWLNEAETRAWIALLEVGTALYDVLARDLKSTTGLMLEDYEVLHFLSQEPGRQMRIGLLTERLMARRTRLSQRIDRLVERGIVERRQCPEDGRAINVALTSEGYKLLTEVAPIHLASARTRVFDHWDADDVHQVGESLGKLVAYLRNAPD